MSDGLPKCASNPSDRSILRAYCYFDEQKPQFVCYNEVIFAINRQSI